MRRYIYFFYGDVAQLGERSVRNAEVVSSILIVSTKTQIKGVQRHTKNVAGRPFSRPLPYGRVQNYSTFKVKLL